MLSWPNHWTHWASLCWTTSGWNSYYFVKLVRRKNNNNSPNASTMHKLDVKKLIKMKNLTIRQLAFSPVAAFDEFFFWLTKKRADKKYKYKLKKLISLVYNINYYSIVQLHRAPQCLYSQHCSYRWNNTYNTTRSLKMVSERNDI